MPEAVYVNIAKCYLLLGNKTDAKQYAHKALAENAENNEAKGVWTDRFKTIISYF